MMRRNTYARIEQILVQVLGVQTGAHQLGTVLNQLQVNYEMCHCEPPLQGKTLKVTVWCLVMNNS